MYYTILFQNNVDRSVAVTKEKIIIITKQNDAYISLHLCILCSLALHILLYEVLKL